MAAFNVLLQTQTDAVRVRGGCSDYCHGDEVTFFFFFFGQILLEKKSFKVNGGLYLHLICENRTLSIFI